MIIKTIIIANIAEAFEDTINKIKIPRQKSKRIKIEHNLCDRTLLWEGDDKVVITPFKIERNILDLNKKILQFNNVNNLYPNNVNIGLSDSIMRDDKLFSMLCKLIRNNPGVRLSPYCVTEKFIKFTECLKEKGLKLNVVEMPSKEATWLVSYLDSKVGSRIEIGRIKSIHKNVPESVVCKNQDEVTRVAGWFYKNDRSCVLKANFGESGWGTLFIKRENFKDNKEIVEFIKKEFKADSIWSSGLILVEEYKSPSKKLSSGSPSSELFLSDRGVEITYLCDQVMGNKGDFLGVALGRNLLDNKTRNELRKISLKVGRRFRKLGYRGFFDIDFILSNNNVPYIIETNMRRTGGTHVYDVAKNLFGDDWEKKCFIISQDNFCYGSKKLGEKQIIDKMNEIMYPMKGRKEGIIISIVNKWEPTLGFIIVSESNKKAMDIYNKMLDIWKIKN